MSDELTQAYARIIDLETQVERLRADAELGALVRRMRAYADDESAAVSLVCEWSEPTYWRAGTLDVGDLYLQLPAPGAKGVVMTQTMIVTITADRETFARVERLLALIERCTKVGHSAFVGTWIDGDGPAALDIKVAPDSHHLFDKYAQECEDLSAGRAERVNFTGRIEIARPDGYRLSNYIR